MVLGFINSLRSGFISFPAAPYGWIAAHRIESAEKALDDANGGRLLGSTPRPPTKTPERVKKRTVAISSK